MTAAWHQPARTAALLVVFVRLIVVVFSLQLGGLIHDTSDIVAAVAELRHEQEQCPFDGPCDDCPAGCPNCHCPNALGALVPASSLVTVLDADATPPEPPRLDRGRAPEGPARPSIYRPPRSLARS
jgi:hypothetical protein